MCRNNHDKIKSGKIRKVQAALPGSFYLQKMCAGTGAGKGGETWQRLMET